MGRAMGLGVSPRNSTLILKKGWWINDLNLRTSSRVSVVLTYGLLGSLIGGGW